MEVKMINVVMKKDFKELIEWFSTNYEKEIGGWITGKVSPEAIVLDGLLIPNQEAGVGSVDMSAKQLVDLRKEYGKECTRIIGEWHSHNSMGCFWSSTDDELITDFMKPREIGIFIVSSKNEHLLRLELRKPLSLSIDKLDYSVESDDKLKETCLKIIKEKVKETIYVSSVSNCYGGWTGSYSGYGSSKKEKKDDVTKQVANMVAYHNDGTIVVRDITWDIADAISNEYSIYHPLVDVGGSGVATVKFKFNDKKKALEFMREMRESLVEYIKQRELVDCDFD